jgi:hypothetical protein
MKTSVNEYWIPAFAGMTFLVTLSTNLFLTVSGIVSRMCTDDFYIT